MVTSSPCTGGDFIVRYEKISFESKTLRLDDNQYIDCKFTNCVLLYAGGKFEVEPFQANGIEIKLQGAALNVSRLLHVVQIAKTSAVPVGAQIELGGARFTKSEDRLPSAA